MIKERIFKTISTVLDTPIGEINENNAREVLKKIIPIIEKYAPSTDDLPKV